MTYDWEKPCRANFEGWAEFVPERLVAYLGTDATPLLLMWAAESAGGAPRELAVPALLRLLDHASPMVREGAIHGLGEQGGSEVLAALRERAAVETSTTVGLVLTEAIEWLEGLNEEKKS